MKKDKWIDTENTANEIEHRSKHLPSRAAAIHEEIRSEGQKELNRDLLALFLSAIAAGLSIGVSLLVKSKLNISFAESDYRGLIESFGYTLGFVIIIMSRQQLFTENTLTAVLPIMHRPTKNNFKMLGRLWGIVLIGNLVGTFIIAYLLNNLSVFPPVLKDAFHLISAELLEQSPTNMFVGGVISGWLIATMVWMLPSSGSSKVFIIIMMTFIISAFGFPHIVVGSVETFYLIIEGVQPWSVFFYPFGIPTVVGNILGGTFIFSVLSHLQIRNDLKARQ
ncbi:formate/nitrite transporter family protein [Moellerella wisconsensis]|uniref:Formate/nitrite transporter family protein n=1 Tax=Moellerella wisconsensis TaxID=158849 RepID=A0A9Q8PZQ1_9GAMM|nr:formate/nitrite transporter family protein [Moellerella wisconsensis]KLN97457.1 membrane protein [Moellerella wisconsensis]UNH22993.1 formate/nitrite transporter family protein [Moellerella wisconsensis]UNH26132.1 formate/nitrite transporter family protein [Moellerella wisconsensis]UNH29546.1 formate/nitrite transporter family protein [Moellerella wisconsensis]UNH41237.1 formate/nitrite transporter family protein [Moellerella wisconsensis]